VHIHAMEAFAAGIAPPQKRGVATLVERLRERQAAGNEHLAAALDEAEASELGARLEALAASAEALP